MDPKKTTRKTDSARAFTQPAVACCAPTFRLDSIAIQENPATSMATATSSKVLTKASASVAVANAQVASTVSRSADSLARKRGSSSAPATAPTPMQARRMP